MTSSLGLLSSLAKHRLKSKELRYLFNYNAKTIFLLKFFRNYEPNTYCIPERDQEQIILLDENKAFRD